LAAESFVAVSQSVAVVAVSGRLGILALNFEVKGNILMFVHIVATDFTLSGSIEGTITLVEDLGRPGSQVTTGRVQTANGMPPIGISQIGTV
jgi:hypothetical protein